MVSRLNSLSLLHMAMYSGTSAEGGGPIGAGCLGEMSFGSAEGASAYPLCVLTGLLLVIWLSMPEPGGIGGLGFVSRDTPASKPAFRAAGGAASTWGRGSVGEGGDRERKA